MNRLTHRVAITTVALTSMFAQIGCDQTVSEKDTVQKKSDGTVVKETDKTTRSNDGSTKTTHEKEVDKSNTNQNP